MSAPPKKKPAPVARKSSAAIPPSTFYTGPTVPKKDGPLPVAPTTKESVTGYSKVNVDDKNLEQIVKSKNLVAPATLAPNPRTSTLRTPRSHRWLNSTILFILLTSLFSLYACPAPNATTTAEPSLYTRLNPFVATPHLVPAWESIVCKPTNAYRTHVLEPYVVPHIQRRIAKVRGNPIVRGYIEPAVVQAQFKAEALWKTRLERPARRLHQVSEQLHGRYVAPRYPIIKARLERLVQYIRYQLTHAYSVVSRTVSSHPTYADASRRLSPFINTAKRRTVNMWNSLIPHVHRARRNAQPVAQRWGGHAVTRGRKGVDVARTRVVPRLVAGVEAGLDRVEVAWERLVAQLRELYAARVYPLLHPHYSSVEPHVNTFSKNVYEPYLRAPLEHTRPLLYSLILTPSLNDIRRALRAGYLDTRAAVTQGVESVKDTIHAVEDKVESVVGDVRGKVGATASSAASVASEAKATVYEAGRNYRQEAIDKAHAAQRVAAESSARARASAASASKVASASVGSVTEQVGANVARATKEGKSVVGEGQSTVSSIVAEVETGAASVASSVSAQGSAAASTATEYAKGAVNSVYEEAQRVSASIQSAASQASVSGGSIVDRATRSAGSVAAEVTQGVASATESISVGVHGAASEVSASGSSVCYQVTRSVGSVASVASQNVKEAATSVSEGANRASASAVSAGSQVTASAVSAASRASEGVRQAGEQVVASGSSVVEQARHGASQVSAQASHTVSSVVSQGSQSAGSLANAAHGSASSVSSRAASAVQSNAETLDATVTAVGSNPGKTTVPHNPEAGEVAALFEEEGVAHQVRDGSQDEVVAKDPTYIKQEVAGVIRTYLQTQVPRIAQDRLLALEHDATTTARAFQQLLSGLELSSEAKDVAAERVKVKASLKSVRSKLDGLVATLEKDLQGGLINAGAKKEVDKIIDAAVAGAGPKPPSTLRQSYHDAAQSVLDTLTNVNEAIAQEARLVLKPYRKEAKDRADQALAVLDGKVTATIVPTETVGRVAEAAAGTIGRAKDQIIADIKHATESGSSVYQSATERAANAASAAAGKIGLNEQAEAVLAGLADFRNHVEEVVEGVTESGKAGAARATQAIKDEL